MTRMKAVEFGVPMAMIWMTRLGLSVIPVGAIAYGAVCLFLLTQQRQFIFFPTAEITQTPADFGVPYEDVWIPVPYTQADAEPDAAQLHGWWIPAAANTWTERPLTVLYLHGNGENIGANAEHAGRFQRMGFNVMLVDYRGYGRSSGPFPSESQVYADAQATWDYLTQTRGLVPEEIVIYGHSLGGAIAIQLAQQTPDAAALIVQSSFTSIRDVAADSGKYRGIPINMLLNQRFDSLSRIPTVQVPTLFIHGEADQEVPPHMSTDLYEAAAPPKDLWQVPFAEHNNVAKIAGENAYATVIREFVAQNINLETISGLPEFEVQSLR